MKPENPSLMMSQQETHHLEGGAGAKGDLEIGFIFFFRSTAITEEKAASRPLIVFYTDNGFSDPSLIIGMKDFAGSC